MRSPSRHATERFEKPSTGKVSGADFEIGNEGTIDYYEKKLNAETKWAYGDYNRCKFNQNSAGLKKLSADQQEIVGRLRDALESYFVSFYTMQAITVGGGNPFELDSLSSQSDVEDLIGKALISRNRRAQHALRKQPKRILESREAIAE